MEKVKKKRMRKVGVNKDLLDMNIERFDSYIEKADNKASFNLAFIGAVLVGILLNNGEINEVFMASIVCLIISGCFSAIVLIPRESKGHFKSLTYYKSVKQMQEDSYIDDINSLDEDNYIKELAKESKELASLCDKKMKVNKIAICFTILALLILVSYAIDKNINNIYISGIIVAIIALIIYFLGQNITG